MKTWVSIVESHIEGLIEVQAELCGVSKTQEVLRQEFYIEVLMAFFRQDSARLLDLKNQDFLNQHGDLKALTDLRSMIREGHYTPAQIQIILSEYNSENTILKAEAHFIAAAAFQQQSHFVIAETNYRCAAALYQNAGAIRKSLRAQLSAIAAYSCEKPESRLFADYMAVFKKAMNAFEFLTAATALTNISREFQNLGGHIIALEHASQAVDLLREHALSTREYGMALTHRAHIYLELKHFAAARQDLTYALALPHSDIQTACSVLAQKFDLNLNHLKNKTLVPTWTERLESEKREKTLSELESKLIVLLAVGPRTKYELMDEIYGELLAQDTKENRFKNILARVRSHLPNLIALKEQRYYLTEPEQNLPLKRGKL